MKKIKIALQGTQHDYKNSLLPIIVQYHGYKIEWVKPNNCDLIIFGAFFSQNLKRYRWAPKPIRSHIESVFKILDRQSNPPLSLFHTCESKRHNTFKCHFSISHDLSVENINHLRLPYWMELVDWSHEDINGNSNPRYGELLSLNQLEKPLGSHFLDRPRVASLITSHMLEPRETLFEAVNKCIEVIGLGPHYNKKILNHHESNFIKKDVMKKYAFNLCPENSMYPGYYTEKIPESFAAGSLPISWTDSNVSCDFNPLAFINLAPMTAMNFSPLKELLYSDAALSNYANQPLITNRPSLEATKKFIYEILKSSKS